MIRGFHHMVFAAKLLQVIGLRKIACAEASYNQNEDSQVALESKTHIDCTSKQAKILKQFTWTNIVYPGQLFYTLV